MSEAIRRIFAEAGPTYDLVNRLLTLGLDVSWRARAARRAARLGRGRWLDVCSGTGDMARALRRAAPAGVAILAADFSQPMLRLAGRKADRHAFVRVAAALPRLPFPDGWFDLATIAFATRNINTTPSALLANFREINRLIRPGGCLVHLETSQPPSAIVRMLFHGYVRSVVGPVGRAVSGSRAAYTYLASTIPRFHGADSLAAILREAGFRRVVHERLLFGAAAIHLAFK